jgi:hypothetical protein
MTMTILAQLGDDVAAFLRNAGRAFVTVAIGATQQLVAQVKAGDTGTLILNLVQAIDGHAGLAGADKFTAILAAIVPILEKLQATGGLVGLEVALDDFARELLQSIVNDLRADLAKIAAA